MRDPGSRTRARIGPGPAVVIEASVMEENGGEDSDDDDEEEEEGKPGGT